MNKCTFCGKEIEDILSKVILNIESLRKREDSTIESVENCNWTYVEILCPNCMEKLVKILQSLNKKEFEED